MFLEERQSKILEMLERDGKVLVKELAEIFGVTEDVSVEPVAIEAEPAPSDPAARSKANGLKQDKVEAFVLRCYRIALNREPGADELDRYVTMIMDGKKSVRQVVQGFIFSDEFKARNLGNTPDPVPPLPGPRSGRRGPGPLDGGPE